MKLSPSDSYGTEYRAGLKRSMADPAKCSCLQCRGAIAKFPITVIDLKPGMPLFHRLVALAAIVCAVIVIVAQVAMRLSR